jgi:hypothetical protein
MPHARRRQIDRLRLGPVVGHTDAATARVWIQVFDDPSAYALRVAGVGLFPFVSTEGGVLEFRTAIAVAAGLRPDRIHTYDVLRRGRRVARGRGRFRTMPDPTSTSDILFAAISCNSLVRDGAWERFAAFVDDAQPRFLLMMGDQVYIDDDPPDIFDEHFDSRPEVRRRALADKYRLNWQREPVRRVLANVPTYMMWDDHEIRDGWGSFAPDSPTLAARYPGSRDIFDRFNAYFEDTRDVYWHFQGCHNPVPVAGQDPALPNYIAGPPPHGQRRAMPYAFRCGRFVVLVVDSRGERDVFRPSYPALGEEQWGFIEHVLEHLAPSVEGLALVTPTPIASLDPEGQAQTVFGDRTDDVERFRRRDLEGLVHFKGDDSPASIARTALNPRLSRLAGRQLNLGGFERGAIDEARDQWSHKFSRPEQVALIRGAGRARAANRPSGSERGLIFLSGVIHVGGIYDITCSSPKFRAPSLISSGISKDSGLTAVVGIYLDDDFEVAPGIRSKLRQVVNTFNFGVVHVVPTGSGAEVKGAVAHEGNSFAVGVDVADLL